MNYVDLGSMTDYLPREWDRESGKFLAQDCRRYDNCEEVGTIIGSKI